VNITASTLATLFFIKIFANTKGVDPSLISTIVMTVAVLIFGEITPKFLAKTNPEKYSMAVYPLIMVFYYLFYPINLLFSGWKWLIAKIFRVKEEDVITEDEILTMVEEAEEDGTLREEETELIRQVIEFDDVEVGDILVPRVNVVGVEVSTPMEEIKDVFLKEGYSRLAVYKEDIDTIIGTVHEKDFFKEYLKGKKNIDAILQNAVYTTEHVKISALLKQLQKKKVHIAVVLDEYGGTLGIVTMEDILEELVGEIWDEHDEEVEYFKKVDENVYLVDGNAPLHETFKFFEMDGELDNFEANTTSGWVIEKLGLIPRAGTKFTHLNLDIEVLKSTVKKVLQIKVTVKELEDEEEN
jgi:CBS domain containing-hemolysin-like protein